jgi:hypothetical protein
MAHTVLSTLWSQTRTTTQTGKNYIMNYSITVPMEKGDSLKAVKSTTALHDMTLIVNNGWATFIGEANTPEEFEADLIDTIEGMPIAVKAVEVW